MNHKHIYYGVSGVGKTTVASELARRSGYLFLELDFLRSKAQALVTKEEEPFIYEYSTEAWKKFGDLDKDNAVKGFLAVRRAFKEYIIRELLQHSGGYVAEIAFIDPRSVIGLDTKVNLVITSNEELHYSHFFLHRPHSQEEDNQFVAARLIQGYLIEEAKELGVEIFDNNQDNKKNN